MAYKDLSTTKSTITITSSDISSSPINVYCSFNMYKKGSRTTGLDVSSGVQRFSPGQTGITTIITAANITNSKNGYIFLKNLSTVTGEECLITFGSTVVGNVGPGSAVLMPYDAVTSDVKITCASNATQEIEFLHIYEDVEY